MVSEKSIIATGMKKEVERVELAISEALKGNTCSLVSGGDAGIYAMAGLVFEMCEKKGIALLRHDIQSYKKPDGNTIEIEIVPGIPALAAGASLLGAPLTHDFAAISLSDLLTPWEKIEKRITAAAAADFVIAIYNPKSIKRNWQLTKAKELILKHRSENTPVGVVTSAMREQQKLSITSLEKMDEAIVDMQTILFVGNESSVSYFDFMYTPRGYSAKYDIVTKKN